MTKRTNRVANHLRLTTTPPPSAADHALRGLLLAAGVLRHFAARLTTTRDRQPEDEAMMHRTGRRAVVLLDMLTEGLDGYLLGPDNLEELVPELRATADRLAARSGRPRPAA